MCNKSFALDEPILAFWVERFCEKLASLDLTEYINFASPEEAVDAIFDQHYITDRISYFFKSLGLGIFFSEASSATRVRPVERKIASYLMDKITAMKGATQQEPEYGSV